MKEGFFFQTGRVKAPADLAAGTHSLSFTATYPGGQDQDSISFVIDPSGQGACR